jgi:ABC-2 type transport system ATP-binding protein
MKNAIEVEGLVKRYRKAKENSVDGVSFSVREGEFFAFLGPNGAGKTTTLSILTTTLAKTGGSVKVAGYDLDGQEKEIRRRIGVIFQGSSIDDNLTAEENIRLHAMLYGVFSFRPYYSLMPVGYKNKVEELSEMLGLGGGAVFRPIKTFSGGMKRKLEIVRSLIHEPKVLFLDEPTTGLDPASRRVLWKYLRSVRQRAQTTMFLTTHYLEEAEDADNVAIINGGRIIMRGTPRDITHRLVQDVLVVDAEDRKILHETLLKHTAAIDGTGPFKVLLGANVRAQDVIKSIPIPLSVLDIDRPTLEEAYLKIIDGGEVAEYTQVHTT